MNIWLFELRELAQSLPIMHHNLARSVYDDAYDAFIPELRKRARHRFKGQPKIVSGEALRIEISAKLLVMYPMRDLGVIAHCFSFNDFRLLSPCSLGNA